MKKLWNLMKKYAAKAACGVGLLAFASVATSQQNASEPKDAAQNDANAVEPKKPLVLELAAQNQVVSDTYLINTETSQRICHYNHHSHGSHHSHGNHYSGSHYSHGNHYSHDSHWSGWHFSSAAPTQSDQDTVV